MGAASLSHARKGGKQHNDEDVIAGGACHNQLGDALVRAVPALHQLNHAGDHHRRGHGCQHGSHHGSLCPGDAQHQRGQQHKSQNFAAGGHPGHKHGGTAHFFQVGQVQGKPRFQQDDNQRHLAQVGGDGQNGGVQQVQHIGPQNDACHQHADDPGQLQPLADGGHGKPYQED